MTPVPKPAHKKKKKLCNGWKDKPNRTCYYCEIFGAERHEVYGGSNRQISIENGFQVDLCSVCHREMTENITTRAQERNKHWKQHYQILWENEATNNGKSEEEAREAFISLIGRNYLELED